ncbi:MAG: SapC family protein [Bilophila sp.]
MPQSIAPLDKVRHAKLTLTRSDDFSFAADLNMAPLLPVEIAEASLYYPIVFLPRNQGSLVPHALFGLEKANHYLDKGKHWTVPYIPLYVLNYPFSLAKGIGEQGEERFALAIDESASQFKHKKGMPLFTKEGEFSELTTRANTTLAQQHKQYDLTLVAMTEVDATGILEEQSIAVRSGSVTHKVQGLRVINREKLMALPDATLVRWTRNGILEILFAHLNSLHLLSNLTRHLPVKGEPNATVQ